MSNLLKKDHGQGASDKGYDICGPGYFTEIISI